MPRERYIIGRFCSKKYVQIWDKSVIDTEQILVTSPLLDKFKIKALAIILDQFLGNKSPYL